MRLYRTPAGQWAGTQADARALAGRDFVEIEVPTSKPELLAFLNEHRVGAPQRVELEQTERLPAPPVAQPAKAPQQPTQASHDCDVEDEIARADLPNAIRLFDHIAWRLNELIKPAR